MRIVGLELKDDTVTLTLENGVTMSVTPHDNYVHLHFSGIEPPIEASAFHQMKDIGKVLSANYMDIAFRPR